MGEALDIGNGHLAAESVTGQGLSKAACAKGGVSVRFRAGGERCRPAKSKYRRSLKKLFQENSVPPWERGRIPLVYVGEELAAVSDLWVCHPYQAQVLEAGWVVRWRKP